MFAKFIIFLILTSGVAFSSEHQMIDTLGSSPKGQFVALEEYGYKSNKHAYYVTIKIMNVWTKKYVGSTIKVERPAHRPIFLKKAREEAKLLAKEELEKFSISG